MVPKDVTVKRQSRKWDSMEGPIQAKFWFLGFQTRVEPQSNCEIGTQSPPTIRAIIEIGRL